MFLAIALVSASAASDEPIVALAIEPEVAAPAPTLESAARANDYATFDALYRANPDPAFRALHELWTYAMTDRIGAFYGAEMYQRLSREYPAYAEYIAHYRIVDGKGEVFYPASETRAFLLENRTATPAVRIAERQPEVQQPEARRPLAGRSTGSLPVDVDAARSVPAGSRRSGRLEAGAPRTVAPPAPVQKAAATQAPVPAPTPAEDLALLNNVTTTPAPAPAPVAAPAQVQVSQAPAAPPKATNRGLLLIILGLAGVGLLALIVRAPREVIQ
ncbi:MAG TPA: hypothetical protein VF432_10320 [Thermoanaerobaculia bacterium]